MKAYHLRRDEDVSGYACGQVAQVAEFGDSTESSTGSAAQISPESQGRKRSLQSLICCASRDTMCDRPGASSIGSVSAQG